MMYTPSRRQQYNKDRVRASEAFHPGVLTRFACLSLILSQFRLSIAQRARKHENDGSLERAWQQQDDFSWCTRGSNEENPTGMLYVKVDKAASSTSAGVAIRIAKSVGQRIHKQEFEEEEEEEGIDCHVQFHHGVPRKLNYANRNRKKSFLWSMVRDPTRRAISHFFHFSVSRGGVEPTDENILKSIKETQGINGRGGFELRYLTNKKYAMPLSIYNMSYVEDIVGRVVDEYDFLGVVERYDESMVALRLLLGLEAGDLLHLNAKMNGGYDSQCTKIVPSVISETVELYLETEDWEERNIGDLVLHEAANRKLDATIAALGQRRFNRALNEHRRLMKAVQDTCEDSAVFPCCKGVRRFEEAAANCYWKDSGCGYPCIDQMMANLDDTM